MRQLTNFRTWHYFCSSIVCITCICLEMGGICATTFMWGSEDNLWSWFSSSSVWIPGINVGSPVLVASSLVSPIVVLGLSIYTTLRHLCFLFNHHYF